jgi:hypothetical protein
MNDERYLRDWLQDTSDSTTDPNAAADRIVARVSVSPQRHRWLPWPSVRRPKTDDVPTNRRNRSMFSPVQSLAAVALALAAGGAMLLATQDTAPAEPAPAAAVEPVQAVPLTVELDFLEQRSFGEKTELPTGSTRSVGRVWVNRVVDASDPRFEGTATRTETVDVYGDVELAIGAWRIENPGGAWQGFPTFGPSQDSVLFEIGTTSDYLFVGEGGYEGLVALLRATHRPEAEDSGGIVIEPSDAPDIRFEGHILNTTDLPEAPEPWSPAE